MNNSFNLEKKFTNPEEELNFLRARIANLEQDYRQEGQNIDRETIIREQLDAYKDIAPAEALHNDFEMTHQEVQGITLNLIPETHDNRMEELLGLVQDNGIKNALSIVEEMKDQHIQDDFHRFLVEYIKQGFPVGGLQEKSPLSKSLRRTVYEISFPEAEKDDKGKHLKEFVSSMEQLYAGLLPAVGQDSNDDYITVELANSYEDEQSVFYVSVADSKKGLFEKQMMAIFPKSRIAVQTNDFNIFNPHGITVGSFAAYTDSESFPIKTYDEFDFDPLNVLLNAFSKIAKVGEGAAVQFVIAAPQNDYLKLYKKALQKVEKGESVKEALDFDNSFSHLLWGGIKDTVKELSKSEEAQQKEKDKKDKEKHVDNIVVEALKKKIATSIASVNLRILSSAPNRARAEEIQKDLEAVFNQFSNSVGNSLEFVKCEGRQMQALSKNFTFRYFLSSESLPMSIRELTTTMHFIAGDHAENPNLKQTKAGTAPAPAGMPQDGVSLGYNIHQNRQQEIFFTPQDRLRHLYVIGQTGTGKTTILKNMIVQDIKNGDGVCMIDPHGSDIDDIMSAIPPERYKDVIYFDPAYTERPMSLNMMEYDINKPEQKTFVVNELFSIFKKLYDSDTMGPAFEQYFRNSALLVMEDPASGNTLLDVSRVLSDERYREYKLARCKNPLVKQFWQNAMATTGEQGFSNYVQYVTNKFDTFLSNDIMRPIVSQQESSFNFRQIMDDKKILLVNLSKGRLGEVNANLIGLILVGKIYMAAMSRVDVLGKGDFPPFYLYIDEFQNVTTDSIAGILSEARKYKLGLTIAHQYIKQIDENIRNAVFGNVGSMSVYRISTEDAEQFEKSFEPVFTIKDIINQDNFNCYLKMLADGKPIRPFSLRAHKPPEGKREIVDKLKQISYLTFGVDRHEVEEKIMKKYMALNDKSVFEP